MLTKISVFAIEFYQHHLSPHKGFCCAHRAYTGEDSCSEYAKKTIASYGLMSALPYIREQFDKCAFAAKKLQQEREEKKNKKGDTEALGNCACDLGCHSLDCLSIVPIPKSCGKKPHSSSSTDICDIGSDCNPFH